MRIRTTLLLLLLLLLTPSMGALAAVPEEDLEEQGRGIIQDYRDMKQDGDIEWAWIAPGTKLSSFRFKAGTFENMSTSVDDDMEDVIRDVLPRALAKASRGGEAAAELTVDRAIYWAQRPNRAKLWIPYAGMHLAQAGVGVELVFRDASGKIVAKIRHSGREGDQLEAAAEELMDDIAGYVRGS